MSEKPSISNANSWLGPRSFTQIRTDYHGSRPLSSKRKVYSLAHTIPGTKVTEYGFGHTATNKGPILLDSPQVARVSSYPGITFPKLQPNSTGNISAKSGEGTSKAERNSIVTPLEKLRIENRQPTSDNLLNRILTHAERCRSRDTTRKGSPKTGLTNENCYDYIVIKSFAKQSEMRQALNRIILSSKKKTPLPTSHYLSDQNNRQHSARSRATCSSRCTDSSSGRASARQEYNIPYSNNNLYKNNSLLKQYTSTSSLKISNNEEKNRNSDATTSKNNVRKLNKSSSTGSLRGDRERSLIQPTLPKLITGNTSCMFRLNGPILLSAPHGLKIWRGGTDGRRRRIHYREVYVTEIVLKLAMEINKYTGFPPSFIIWDRKIAMPADFRNLDPNYLTERQFSQSPWHEALEQFKIYGTENKLPIFHIDIHGKKDRKTNMDVDAGFRAMETRWEDKKFVSQFKEDTHAAFTKVFIDPSYEKRGMKYEINVDPLLCGDWGGDLYTMTSQSVCLGIPSFQLEIPRTVRTRLIEDDDFASKFAKAIVDIYTYCIQKGTQLPSMKGTEFSTNEQLQKLYNDHLKIEKSFQEKQI